MEDPICYVFEYFVYIKCFLFQYLHEKFRALLIGVKVVAQKKVLVTPLDHTIGINDIAFVIAQSQAEANR